MSSKPSSFRVSGRTDGPWVTLSHPIGSSMEVWNPVLQRLEETYQVLVYDIRGHGHSAFLEGDASFDDLAADCVALWDQLGIKRSHFVGLSLGGCIGVALASRASERVHTLSVACARIDVDDQTAQMWRDRAELVLAQGMDAVVDATLERWLSPEFRAARPDVVAQTRSTLRHTSPAAFAQCARALAKGQSLSRLNALSLPVQYLGGVHDKAVPVVHLMRYHEATPFSRHLSLHGPHLLHVECPQAFSDAVMQFMAEFHD